MSSKILTIKLKQNIHLKIPCKTNTNKLKKLNIIKTLFSLYPNLKSNMTNISLKRHIVLCYVRFSSVSDNYPEEGQMINRYSLCKVCKEKISVLNKKLDSV